MYRYGLSESCHCVICGIAAIMYNIGMHTGGARYATVPPASLA